MTQSGVPAEPPTEAVASTTATSRNHSSWPAAVGCICLFASTTLLLRAYSYLHWEILFHNRSSLSAPLTADLLRLLGLLEFYRLTAIFSLAFGICAFWGQPRWLGWVCLPFTLLSLLSSVVVM